MWEIIRQNKRKTIFLMVCLGLLMLSVGYILAEAAAPGAGILGLAAAGIVWVVQAIISYFCGDALYLAISGAKEISQADCPQLWNVVEEMKIASGLNPMPRIFLIDEDAPNAFATGRSPEKAAITVTSGLLKMMTRSELQGVIGHEISHVNNRDILYMLMVTSMMGTIIVLVDIAYRASWGSGSYRRASSSSKNDSNITLIIGLLALVLVIVAPLLAQLMYYAISQKREYLADACSAQYTRYPEGLACALEKLSQNTEKLHVASKATAPLFIVNPFNHALKDRTSTHPPLEKRIAILRSMTSGAGLEQYNSAYTQVTGKRAGLFSKTTLTQAGSVALIDKPLEAEPDSALERTRMANNAIWSANQYQFITCVCGTQLKIPPHFPAPEIQCPSCGKSHAL